MKKFIALIMTISLFSFILSGCSMDSGIENNDSKGDKTIGLSISTLNNPFFVSVRDGVKNAAEKEGIALNIADAQNDSAKQINDIDDLIQRGVSILIINPVDSAAISSAVEAANSANIPVITLDRSADSGKVEALVASDNIKGGEMAAEYIINALGENAKVAELEGIPGASATRERGEGFHKLADEKLDIVAKQAADFDRTKGLTVAENILQGHSDVQAIFAQNDEMALGAVEAAQAAGKDIIIVGFDGNEDGMKAVKDGRMAATIAQQPELMGELSVKTAVKVLNGDKVDEKVPVELKLVE
ncbi:MAG: ribose ABC transporter substrate-binding protein RbsB [Andreesenia angusta]|nr:ribose ABC transporter substrate-binding protein RbsB [Andreesenia angusta]